MLKFDIATEKSSQATLNQSYQQRFINMREVPVSLVEPGTAVSSVHKHDNHAHKSEMEDARPAVPFV